jgi:hypothetical protein
MKKVMFVFGIVFCALSSPAIADVAKSSKGAAHCAHNTPDHLKQSVVSVVKDKKSADIAK